MFRQLVLTTSFAISAAASAATGTNTASPNCSNVVRDAAEAQYRVDTKGGAEPPAYASRDIFPTVIPDTGFTAYNVPLFVGANRQESGCGVGFYIVLVDESCVVHGQPVGN